MPSGLQRSEGPASRRQDVMLVADMCVDIILRGNVRPRFGQFEQIIGDYILDIGGSGNLFAAQAAKLGLGAAVLGHVGADAFGDFLVRRLAEEGVDTSRITVDPALRTGLGVTLTEPGDRAILTYPGSIDAFGGSELPARPGDLARHWHVASFYLLDRLRPAWAGFLAAAKAAGMTTSLDPNWDPSERWDGVEELLPHVDIFFPNDAELAAISGEADLVTAARRLSRSGPMVVVKCGPEGALAVRGDEVVAFRPDVACAADRVVDSVGAGDNFDAGFLSAWLAGEPVEACLRRGHRCAAASLVEAGGVAAQLRAAEVFQSDMEGT